MLSGDKLGIIDPHQQIFSASSHCWNIGKRSDLLSSLSHQLEPYLGTFGCDASSFRSGFYRGTLFRFPLRQKSSSLSNILYSNEKVQLLLQNFEHDAHLLLIFVKNLEKISVFDREKHSKSARLLFRAEISAECLDEVRFIAGTSDITNLKMPAKCRVICVDWECNITLLSIHCHQYSYMHCPLVILS